MRAQLCCVREHIFFMQALAWITPGYLFPFLFGLIYLAMLQRNILQCASYF